MSGNHKRPPGVREQITNHWYSICTLLWVHLMTAGLAQVEQAGAIPKGA